MKYHHEYLIKSPLNPTLEFGSKNVVARSPQVSTPTIALSTDAPGWVLRALPQSGLTGCDTHQISSSGSIYLYIHTMIDNIYIYI